jgi:hypothetical protein
MGERVEAASCQGMSEKIREYAIWACVLDVVEVFKEEETVFCYQQTFAAGSTTEENFKEMIKVRDKLYKALLWAESSLKAEEAHL